MTHILLLLLGCGELSLPSPGAATSSLPAPAPAPAAPVVPAAPPPAAPSPAPTGGAPARLIFAANLADNAPCADHGRANACDLYTASLDLGSGAISGVARLTTTRESESYPAWHPSGSLAYYTILKDERNKNVGVVSVPGGNPHVILPGATWPEVSPDGKTLVYHDGRSRMLMAAPLTNGQPGPPVPLTGRPNQDDADFAPDGRAIVFHDTTSGQATGMVYDRGTGRTATWTERSGHCGFGGAGGLTMCDNSKGGGLYVSSYQNGTLGTPRLLIPDPRPAELAAADPAFAGCTGTSFNYPTFCGDDTHVLVSTSCNMAGTVTISRLFLLDLTTSPPAYRAIGKAIADNFHGPGGSTWTVDCLRGG